MADLRYDEQTAAVAVKVEAHIAAMPIEQQEIVRLLMEATQMAMFDGVVSVVLHVLTRDHGLFTLQAGNVTTLAEGPEPGEPVH